MSVKVEFTTTIASFRTLDDAPFGWYTDADGALLLWHPSPGVALYVDGAYDFGREELGPYTPCHGFRLTVTPE